MTLRRISTLHDTNMAGGLGRPETRGGVLVLFEPDRSAVLRRKRWGCTPGAALHRSWPCDRHLSRSSRCGLHELEHLGSRSVLARHSHRRPDDRACVRAVPHELPAARKFGAAPPRPPCAEVPRRSCSRKTPALGAEACRPARVRQAGPPSDGSSEDYPSATPGASFDAAGFKLTDYRTTRTSPRVRSIGPNVGVPRRPASTPTVPSSS